MTDVRNQRSKTGETILVLPIKKDSTHYQMADETDSSFILNVHDFLVTELGINKVESFNDFKLTTSKKTDDLIVPHVSVSISSNKLTGVVIGAYIKTTNIGILLYSAVHNSVRGRGVYSNLKSYMLEQLNSDSRENEYDKGGYKLIDYLVSEVEHDSWLFKKYTDDWGSFVADFEYLQPAVQGLGARPLKLVLQPINKFVPPSKLTLKTIVIEIYRRVYRLTNLELTTYMNNVVQSQYSI